MIFLFLFGYIEGINAIVDSKIITRGEVEKNLTLLLLEQPLPDSLKYRLKDSLREEVLKQLIYVKLLEHKAREDSIEIDYARIAEEAENRLDVIKKNIGGEDSLIKLLRNNGISLEDLSKFMANQVLLRFLIQMILNKEGFYPIYVPPSEVKSFYNKHKDSIAVIPAHALIAHIVVPVVPSRSKEMAAQRKLMEVYDILSRGGDWDVVCSSFSRDYKTKDKGGYIGWVERGGRFKESDSILFSPHKYGDIFVARSMKGYHLFRFLGKRGDSIKLAHIFFPVTISRSDTLSTIREMESLRKEILKDTSQFYNYAQKYSIDRVSAERGGIIGDVLINALDSPFKEVAEKAESGYISKPVVSQYGVHLIWIKKKEDKQVKSFKELRSFIENYLRMQKEDEIVKELIKNIKEKVFVKIYD